MIEFRLFQIVVKLTANSPNLPNRGPSSDLTTQPNDGMFSDLWHKLSLQLNGVTNCNKSHIKAGVSVPSYSKATKKS